jgi:hypothetical protein
MKISTIIVILSLFSLSGCGFFLPGFLDSGTTKNIDLAGQLFINEVSADNPNADDWVELYNGSSGTIDLSGFYLSDSATEPTKWAIPPGTAFPAGGFLVIDCDGKDKGLHASFKLNPGTDGLYLSTPREAFSIDSIATIPSAGTGSYARQTNGGSTWVILTTPTPGKSNS